MISRREFVGSCGAMIALGGCATGCFGSGRWYKGMLHCHSCWSDGRSLPEQMVDAYRRMGYDFMSLTDHNRLSWRRGEWRTVCTEDTWWPKRVPRPYFENAKGRFPWLQVRKNEKGEDEVRVTPYAELVERFNDAGRFLLIPGFEATRGTGEWDVGRQVHMNLIGVAAEIPSQGSPFSETRFKNLSAANLIRKTREECEALAKAAGDSPHLITLNHPHWPYYDNPPSDVLANPEVRFFEICNDRAEADALPELAHCNGYDNDRFWDVANAFRARADEPLLYATAVDDAHWAAFTGATAPGTCEGCYTGDGYIRVRADALTRAALFAAMDRGDFYASTGLDLDDVSFDGRTLRVRTLAEKSFACRIKFIVTKRGFDDRVVKAVKTVKSEKMKFERTVPLYSDEIGQVAKEAIGERGKPLEASYTLAPDDLYVRARIESERPSPWVAWHKDEPVHPIHPLKATAWTQPYRGTSLR